MQLALNPPPGLYTVLLLHRLAKVKFESRSISKINHVVTLTDRSSFFSSFSFFSFFLISVIFPGYIRFRYHLCVLSFRFFFFHINTSCRIKISRTSQTNRLFDYSRFIYYLISRYTLIIRGKAEFCGVFAVPYVPCDIPVSHYDVPNEIRITALSSCFRVVIQQN